MNFSFGNPSDYGIDTGDIVDVPDGTAVFSLPDKDYGISPPPRPSKEANPEWYDDSLSPEIKDALNEGWMLRTPCKIETLVEDCDGRGLKSKNNFDDKMFSTHHPAQMESLNIPFEIIKIHSNWTINLPEGYSALLTAPFGMVDDRYTRFSGCVDYDKFPTVTHMPGLLETDEHITIHEGEPLGQVIVFKRDDMIDTATAREATEEEAEELIRDNYERADREPTETEAEIEPL